MCKFENVDENQPKRKLSFIEEFFHKEIRHLCKKRKTSIERENIKKKQISTRNKEKKIEEQGGAATRKARNFKGASGAKEPQQRGESSKKEITWHVGLRLHIDVTFLQHYEVRKKYP